MVNMLYFIPQIEARNENSANCAMLMIVRPVCQEPLAPRLAVGAIFLIGEVNFDGWIGGAEHGATLLATGFDSR